MVPNTGIGSYNPAGGQNLAQMSRDANRAQNSSSAQAQSNANSGTGRPRS